MTDTTNNMGSYDASGSDCMSTRPRLLDSRKPRYRSLHSRRSSLYKRRFQLWKKRLAARLNKIEDPYISSADEPVIPSHLMENGFPNREFLPFMPRPSEIVPAIDEGSASDAGFPPQAREIHRRRLEATRVMLNSLDSRGIKLPVPSWKRDRCGLQKYTPFMVPPREDTELPDLRVPPPLLSRFYRGSLLVVHRVGRPRKRRRIAERSRGPSEPSAGECEFLGVPSYSDTSITDEATSDILVKPEVEDHIAPAARPTSSSNDVAKFSKSAFLKELDQIAEGSSDGLSEDDLQAITSNRNLVKENSEDSNVRERNIVAKESGRAVYSSTVEKKHGTSTEDTTPSPKAPTELSRLLQLVTKDPTSLFTETKPVPKKEPEVQLISHQPVEQTETKIMKESKMTPFQKEKRLAMLFCHGLRKSRRHATQALIFERAKHADRESSQPTQKDEPMADGEAIESRMNMGYAMKVMNKMGFTGRLGKKEDGRREPVLPSHRMFRSGVGSTCAKISVRTEGSSLLSHVSGKKRPLRSPEASSKLQPVEEQERSPVVADRTASCPRTGTDDGRDMRAKRRKMNQPSHAGDSVPGQSHTISKAPGDIIELDEKPVELVSDGENVYETENEDIGIDNGRRAVLIDFDSLIKCSVQRQTDAYELVLKEASLSLDVKIFLERQQLNLCDDDLLIKVLGHANVKPDMMAQFREKLDEAYERLPRPELNHELFDQIRLYANQGHFGIFHRGSHRRMEYELTATGLLSSFLQEICSIVKKEEPWPYIQTWKDLICQTGVASRQCLLVLNRNKRKGTFPCDGSVAAGYLGAQAAEWDKRGDEIAIHITKPMQNKSEVKKGPFPMGDRQTNLFNELVYARMPRLKRRRVLAVHGEDGLWYSASVLWSGEEEGKCWVKYHGSEKQEWVDIADMVPLRRKDYYALRKLDFPGLIDGDASVL